MTAITDLPIREGLPDPLGATWDGNGVNFALFSAHATRVELASSTMAVQQLILNLSDLVGRAVGEAVTVEISADPELWPSRLDPARFESAILNLAVNARDAMPKGGRLMIALSVTEADVGRVDLVV